MRRQPFGPRPRAVGRRIDVDSTRRAEILRRIFALRAQLPLSVRWVAGLVVLAGATVAIVVAVDRQALATALSAAASSPLTTAVALGAFGAAFVVRAAVWSSLLPRLPFRHALAAVHLSLGGNHVLPLRMGEPLRPLSVVRRTGIPWEVAASSTLTLRAADLVSLAVIGLLASPVAARRVAGGWAWLVVALLAVVGVAGLGWMRSVARHRQDLRLPGPVAVAGTVVAWCLEAVLVWQCARWAGLDLTATDALLVTSAAVVAQVAAIAPGGIGTYELASVAAYSALGHEAAPALVAAVTAHALKTAYSLGAGAVALVVPAPAFVGRLRLGRPPAGPGHGGPGSRPAPPAPVVLVLPARDEEATVAQVVGRAPGRLAGHPVEVVVVDDHSSDRTAERARAAGAAVIATGERSGLGAAVREGLAYAVARQPAAVAFCDADGEYAPEELEQLVAPILAGEADYVVGSRFAGRIGHMRAHRRIGNRILTTILSFVARRRITDGQSGYRALSPLAATRAEIVHDYNYAQVLTLDLLAKGFRYTEVPISYSFRSQGRSFVRLPEYLGHVVPAVYRQLNAPASISGLRVR